jgi:hypothetical protein
MICFITSLAKHKFVWLDCPLAHLLKEKRQITPNFISGMSAQISEQAHTVVQKPTHKKFNKANQVNQFSTPANGCHRFLLFLV